MRTNLKSQPEWLKASVSSRPVGVDRQNNILRGYVLAQQGPFKSEGRGEFNLDGLREIMRLGNAKEAGLKSRFTHPDMSSDGLGKFLGRSKKLFMSTALDERTGKSVPAVRGDLHFDKTALDTPPDGGKPLGVYVMDLAESDAAALSSSLVLKPREEWRLNKDGTMATDEEGNELPPLWFPEELHASDVVDTGDAVDGILGKQLSIDSLPLAALWRGEQLLDSVFDGWPREVIEERLKAYMDRYLNRKFGEPQIVSIPTPRLDSKRLALEKMSLTTRELLR